MRGLVLQPRARQFEQAQLFANGQGVAPKQASYGLGYPHCQQYQYAAQGKVQRDGMLGRRLSPFQGRAYQVSFVTAQGLDDVGVVAVEWPQVRGKPGARFFHHAARRQITD